MGAGGTFNFTWEVPPDSSLQRGTVVIDNIYIANLTFQALADDSGTYKCIVDGVTQTASVDITVGKDIVMARMKVVNILSL